MNTHPLVHPLSASQELLWELMTGLSPGNPGATPEVAVGVREVRGPLDPEVFHRAVAEVARRHDPLRMRFHTIDEEPLVTIEPAIDPPLRFLDLNDMPAGQQEKELAALHAEAVGQPFELRRGPLWRAQLVRLAPERHVLVAVFFHLVADGWSTKVFVEDVITSYRSLMGRCPAPPAVGVRFPDIIGMQGRELAASPARVEFWRRSLRPVPKGVPYPVRPVSPETNVRASAATRFRLPAHVSRRLRGVAWRAKTTEYLALLAAYHLLLWRRTGADRIVIGTTTLGRSTSLARRLIGQFTNDVYVVADIHPTSSLADLVGQVHHGLEAAMRNAVSYRSLAAAAHPDFAAQRPWPDVHLFDSYFQAEPPAAPELVVDDLSVRQIEIDQPDAGADGCALPASTVPTSCLPVWIKKGAPIMIIDDDRRGGALVCNPGFFEEHLAGDLVAEYVELVEAVAEDPSRTVAAFRTSV